MWYVHAKCLCGMCLSKCYVVCTCQIVMRYVHVKLLCSSLCTYKNIYIYVNAKRINNCSKETLDEMPNDQVNTEPSHVSDLK